MNNSFKNWCVVQSCPIGYHNSILDHTLFWLSFQCFFENDYLILIVGPLLINKTGFHEIAAISAKRYGK